MKASMDELLRTTENDSNLHIFYAVFYVYKHKTKRARTVFVRSSEYIYLGSDHDVHHI